MSNQAVYDFDPDAYERYLAKQAVVARWVDQTKQHEPANPFTIIPSDASPPIQHPYSSHEQAAIGQWVDRPKQHEPANLFAAPFSGERERLDPKVPPQSPPQIQQVPYGYPYPYPYYPYPYQYQYPYQTMPHYPQGQLIPQYSTLPMSNIPPVIPQTLTP
jgi:hypothetical protein